MQQLAFVITLRSSVSDELYSTEQLILGQSKCMGHPKVDCSNRIGIDQAKRLLIGMFNGC
jgi:hypothetical protein